MKYKKVLSIILASIFIISSMFITSAQSSESEIEEFRIIAQMSSHTISPGLVYTASKEIINNKRQEIYRFEYSHGLGTEVLPVYGEYIYGFNSIGELIDQYDGGHRIVGGINTDFFITNTGIPLSCLVDNYEIISSCDSRPALGIDSDGNAVIGFPQIDAKLYSNNQEIAYDIAHINKTPAEWGIYLVTDKFNKTTKSKGENIEVVFRPFEVKKLESNVSSDAPDLSTDSFDNTIEAVEDTTTYVVSSVEEGRVSTEEVVENDESDSNLEISPEIALDDIYFFNNEIITLQCEIDVVITEIRDGINNGIVPEDCFVACIPKDKFGYLAADWRVGDEFKIITESNRDFVDCVSIFGTGSIFLSNGEKTPHELTDTYRFRNPRTAAGIKEDGTLVFVCVDGRRPGISTGFTIDELADYFIELGCIEAINFDGGGSTTFYAANVGEKASHLKNIPSDGVERKVSDGLVFVNTTSPLGDFAHALLYPENYLMFNKNTNIEINNNLKIADSNFHPIETDRNDITITVDTEFGDTSENIFSPNGTTGSADIYISFPESELILDAGDVVITDTVSDVSLEASTNFLTPFEDMSELEIAAFLNTIPVVISPQSAEWEIYIKTPAELDSDQEIKADSYNPSILEKEVQTSGVNILLTEGEVPVQHHGFIITAVDDNAAYIDFDNLSFYPLKRGVNYLISVKLGGISKEIEIFAEDIPFYDMKEHWAAETSYDMFKKELLIGEFDIVGNRFFMPERNMTKAEFCVVLARILGLDEIELPLVVEKTSDEIKSSDCENEQIEELYTDEEEQEADVDASCSMNNYSDEVTEESWDSIENSVAETNSASIENDNMTEKEIDHTIECDFSSLEDVPIWAKNQIYGLYISGYIDDLFTLNNGSEKVFGSNDYITRNDVIRVLGALMVGDGAVMPSDADMDNTETTSEYLKQFDDLLFERTIDELYYYTLIKSGVIKGYEDGTIRQYSNLTRAEAATVLSRFISQYYSN